MIHLLGTIASIAVELGKKAEEVKP